MDPPTTRSFDRYVYPMLRAFTPVLSRGPAELQVGFDQEPALILAEVDARLKRVLTLLDGGHRLTDIRSWSRELGVGIPDLDWCLSVLDDAGLLSEGGRRDLDTSGRGAAARAGHGASLAHQVSQLSERRVRLIGAGGLGRQVAGLLVRSGIGVLHVIDNDPPDPSLYPAAGAVGTQAEALVAYLGPHRGSRVVAANHWSKPEGQSPALTIVATEFLECDRVVATGLVRADQPHLVIRARAGGVVVGPLVVPGQTACLGCTDLSRRDADPAWPTLLAQLVRIRVSVAPALADWAAGVALAQAMAHLHGTPPETCGATIEITPADYLTRWRSWAMHPACGCGWGATAQWGS